MQALKTFWRNASRRRRLVALTLSVAILATLAVGVHTLGRFQGWFVETVAPHELSEMLAPHYSIYKPAGVGPFPTALIYPGCDGPQDNAERWSDYLVDHGWAAIVVDSHTPRGFLDLPTWRLVCTGQLMPGPERAGDLLVSIADATQMPFVDGDRLALIGMSHGGWSIMDLMTRDLSDELPVNLRRMPVALEESELEGVRSVVLLYPWCGLANRARHQPWRHDAPILFILATQDFIAPAFECELTADKLEATGHHVERVRYEGATHGFDQHHRSEFSPLRFEPEATADALARAIAFMTAADAAPSPSDRTAQQPSLPSPARANVVP